ncbi:MULTISPECIES: YncE family protein [unclassified Frankia]|uniref:YncE family protein n=1 Tax=unclassified Frankia TaxID=2632575 RepID=UPI002AD317FF|nr:MULTISPECIES: YncE family protein [unclassified Frankia]
MRRREHFDGAGAPFEGDRTVWLRSIPQGARLSSAVLTLTPVAPAGSPMFEEIISFSGEVGTWGATLSRGDMPGLRWTELDFHQRRTLTRIRGGNLTGAELQVDFGGVYVRLNNRGAPLSPNDAVADVFTLAADGAVPGLTASKFKLTHTTNPLAVGLVTLRSTPSNLVARAGSQPAFWSRPGELVRAESTPDVAAALQAALATAVVEDGFYRLPLVVHSDTLCRLELELAMEFTVATPALPGGLTEATLTYDYAGVPRTGGVALRLSVPAGARLVPAGTRARATGAFQDSRIGHGPTGAVTPAGALPLTAAESLACPVVLADDLAVTAVDLLLAATTPTATLLLDVVADTDGKPWNEPLLPHPVAVRLERGTDGGPRWVNALLPVAYIFRAGQRYWLTLQIERGEAAWSVLAAAAPSDAAVIQRSVDGGLSWRQASAGGVERADGLFRLRIVPAHFTMPVEVEVGEGASARRVGLERLAPLGRVEIDLAAEEILDGVNAVLAAAPGAEGCPTGEHVRNGDFAHWRRTAELPTGSRLLDGVGFPVRRVAVAADGCRAFVAGGAPAEGTGGLEAAAVVGGTVLARMAAIDVFADHVAVSTVAMDTGHSLDGLAADPDGRYGYLLLDGVTLVTLDAGTGLTTTATLAHSGLTAVAPAVEGTTLYLAGTHRVMVVGGDDTTVHSVVAVPASDVRAGDTQLGGAGQLWGAEAILTQPPVDLAVSPDGSTLWVLTRGDGDSALVAIDTGRLTVQGPGIPLAPAATRCALSANGRAAAVVHSGSASLSVVDLASAAVRSLDLRLSDGDKSTASGVAVSGDGRHAFVTLEATGAVAVVDLAQSRVVDRVTVGHGPVDCVITPDGERIYVADSTESTESTERLTVLTAGALLPEDWVVTAGTVRPWCLPPGGRVAVIGARPAVGDDLPPAATAALAQVMPVSGGCRYELTFVALASVSGASAELHWRGPGCSVERTDEVPILAGPTGKGSGPMTHLPRKPAVRPRPELQPHRAVLAAPAGAEQVELRFRAQAGVVAVVDQVSLRATENVLTNGNLALDGDVFAGWEVSPPAPAGFAATAASDHVLLVNGAGVAVTVAQRASVQAGRRYRLLIDATTPSADGVAPSVEVLWSAAGSSTGPVLSVPLTSSAATPQLRIGQAPAGADTAQVRVVLPPGSVLRLGRVTLDAVAITEVPVTFIAASPGELTVTDWQITYDVDETPRVPPLPAGGLCRPGRSQPVPGEGPVDACYCGTCQGEHQLLDPEPTATASGLAATRFTCANCGSDVVLPGKPGLR